MKYLAALSILAVARNAFAAEVHGSGAEGTVMGPVAFLWPSDRPWSSDADNVAPCGSSAGITNRTNFPLGSIGSIELTIADEVFNIAVRIAYGNNPTTQDDFQNVKSNVSELEPGHQCYPVSSQPSTRVAGSNATIQLEYWASDRNKKESFFACADITFVEVALFTEQVPCFNVTASEFELPASTSNPASTSAATATNAAANSPTTNESYGGSGLSAGSKVGIAVAAIFGTALIVGAAFLFFRRRRQVGKDLEEVSQGKRVTMTDTASIGSEDTAH